MSVSTGSLVRSFTYRSTGLDGNLLHPHVSLFFSQETSPGFGRLNWILRQPRSSSPVFRAAMSSSPQEVTAENEKNEDNLHSLIQSHQEKATRLSPIEEVRTLLERSTRGVLSTFSQKHDGYPSSSMVDFACDGNGSLILAVSSLAIHTKELLSNPKCCFLINKDPEDRSDLVINVHGDAVFVSDDKRDEIRSFYLKRHPESFWVDFGDFKFVTIEPKAVRYMYGVATALLGSGDFTREEYKAAKVDPVSQFSKPITAHMNKDHADDTKAIVQYSTSIKVQFAHMLDVDSLGFNVKESLDVFVEAGYQGETFKLRIPFPRRAEDRKDVKNLIVDLLQSAKSAGLPT